MSIPTERFTPALDRLAFEHYDSCTSCNRRFKEADHANYGYLEGDVPAYVCDDCSRVLTELAARRYFLERAYEVPPGDSKLWRYMDFTKYVGLLSSRALYFCRADQFDDTYEGAKGLKRRKDVWDRHYLEFFRSAVRDLPPGYNNQRTDAQIEAEAVRLLGSIGAIGETSRTRTFISCWHESAYESAAMWRLYSSFLPNAVAVRSSFSNLYRALGQDPSIKIGRVRYLDLDREFAGVNDAFWRKRKSFEHEREVRAIVVDGDAQGVGKLVPCDVSTLIERVFVSPEAPGWFVDILNDVNDKFGLGIAVAESDLREEPFF